MSQKDFDDYIFINVLHGKLRCDGNVLILSFSFSVINDRSLLQVNVYFVTSADKCDYYGKMSFYFYFLSKILIKIKV